MSLRDTEAIVVPSSYLPDPHIRGAVRRFVMTPVMS